MHVEDKVMEIAATEKGFEDDYRSRCLEGPNHGDNIWLMLSYG